MSLEQWLWVSVGGVVVVGILMLFIMSVWTQRTGTYADRDSDFTEGHQG